MSSCGGGVSVASVTRGREDGAMGETSNSGGIRSVAGNRLENRKPSGPVTNG